mgnify:CR=1 FL=1
MKQAIFEQPILNKLSRQKLTDEVLQALDGQESVPDDTLMRCIVLAVTRHTSGTRYTLKERQSLARSLFNAMRGLDLLQPLIDHTEITEIMVNGPDQIFFEQKGQLFLSGLHFDNEQHLTGVITNFFGRANRLIHESKPLADMRLSDGSRVHAALPPVAPDGPILTIRKFTGFEPTLSSLIEQDFITQEASEYLAEAIVNKLNLFICGGTGSGKTTFLNILAQLIPQSERVITIEDAAELNLHCLQNWVRLEARQPGPDGQGAVTLSHLIRSSLRMRPDRIIVGEVRGPEAFDMLQAMNTGHPGSLSTGHANSCSDMLNRLALMVLMGIQLPWDAIHSLIASSIDIMIHLHRNKKGGREIQEIAAIRPCDSGSFSISPLFVRSSGGILQNVGHI